MTLVALLTDTVQPGQTQDTAYGLSAPIGEIDLGGRKALVCGQSYADPRATVQALKDEGATHMWLCESVGGLKPLQRVGKWLVPDDYIDGTRGQHYTFFSEKAGGYVQQVPPFDPDSRSALFLATCKVEGRPHPKGIYVCVSNTRLETPAEAAFWERAGGHVVGRFLSPYLTLARELEMKVAAVVHVTRAGGEAGDAKPFDYFRTVLEAALANLES